MSHHHLNILPVEIPDAQIEVGIIPFDSREALKHLRKEHNSKYLFKRTRIESHDAIIALRLDGEPFGLAGEKREINLREHLGLVASLTMERFLASFSGQPTRRVVDVNPLKVLSSLPQHDLIAQAAQGQSVPDWLITRLCHSTQARVFNFDKQEAFVGLVLDYHTFREVGRPCSEWIDAGLDLRGLYVSERITWTDTRVQPRGRLVGKVAKVTGRTLHLVDCREGRETVEAQDVHIEADYDGFMRVLSATYNANAKAIERRLFDLQSRIQQGPQKFNELLRLEQRLVQHSVKLLPGIVAKVLPHLDEHQQGFPEVRKAPQALFVFDPTFNKPAYSEPLRGISEHGPYSQRNFTPSKPRICVVCQANRKGEVEQFLRKLLQGNVEPGRRSYFPNGLIKTYRLQDCDIKFYTAENDSAAAYRKAVVQATGSVINDADRWHLAIVQVDGSSHLLHGEANPYLVAKAAFLAQQIPVQEFRTETMLTQGSSLDFILSNIALACYSKLGGTPWQLKVDTALAHELVVGLGSASISDTRLGSRQRLVGVTTLFTNEGKYLIGNMSQAVPFEEYGSAVVEMLRGAIEQARVDMNWQKRDSVRLIVHSFKPMKDSEAEAVKIVAEQLTDYHVEFAFLHIAQDHNSFVVDSESTGETSYRGEVKGAFVPLRGTYMNLNKRDALLSLTGGKQIKKATDGLPYPLLLHLHRSSTFNDLTYLTQQVYTFACHSWRTFDKAGMPVTILYSELIARLLGKLALIPQFSIDSIHGRLNKQRWFL
jgi:hypothetical protein